MGLNGMINGLQKISNLFFINIYLLTLLIKYNLNSFHIDLKDLSTYLLIYLTLS